MKTLLLDVDGVLANFIGGIIQTHGWPFTHKEFNCWDYHRTHGYTDEEMWEPTKDGKWWLGLDPYDHAADLLAKLRETHNIIFCTAPNSDATCASQKIQWLEKHGFMEPGSGDYQIGKHKHLNAMSGCVLIDDSDENVWRYRHAGGRAILFPQPWNDNRGLVDCQLTHVVSELEAYESGQPFPSKSRVVCKRDSAEIDTLGWSHGMSVCRAGDEYQIESCVLTPGSKWAVMITGELHPACDFEAKA